MYEKLHRKQLKSKIVYKNEPELFLSKEECNAAYKLAAALANYDEDDYRSLKFLDLKERKTKSMIKLPKIQNWNKLIYKLNE